MDVRSPFFQNVATVLVGVMFLNPIVGAAAELTVAAGSNATLGQAGNGVPIVNIAAPNGKGLSHNKFKDYNVGQQGLILNNATERTQSTQLGGIILGNSNLNGRAAGMILNEVTGANASRLQGYTEVAGKSAHVIVANPHGISCDGCGFINTPRVTLSTGTPIVENGRLDRFDVNGGSIAIEGRGLNASNVDQFDLITRSAKINAELHANRLNIITGRNEVKADDLSVTAKAPDGSDQPRLAIDSSALGGMYAGAIRLVGTEAGVGVKLAGDMAASAGDIRIDANGKLTMARTASSGDLTASAQSVELAADTYAGGAVRIEAGDALINARSLAAGKGIALAADSVKNEGVVEAGVRIDGSTDPAASLQIDSRTLANDGTLLANGRLQVRASEQFDNRGGTLAGTVTDVNAGSLANASGRVLAEQTLTIEAGALDNQTGLLQSRDKALIVGTTVDNREGDVVALGNLSVTARELDNSQRGRLRAGGTADVVVGSIDNRQGVVAAGSLALEADGIDNRDGGLITSEASLNLKAAQLDSSNGGELSAGGDIKATVGTLTQQRGRLIGDGRIQIDLQNGTLDNRKGLIKAHDGLAITNAANVKNQGGELSSSADVQLSGKRLGNADGGRVIAGGELRIEAGAVDNQNGGLLSGWQGLILQGGSLDNSGLGTLSSREGGVSVQLTGTLDNGEEGAVVGKQALDINVAELRNAASGILSSEGDVAVRVSGTFDNTGNGLLNAGGALTVQASDVLNRAGVIRSGADLLLVAMNLDNRGGLLTGGQALTLTLTERLLNAQGGQLAGVGPLMVMAGEVDNRGGQLASQSLLELLANRLDNSAAGTLASAGPMRLELGGLLDNSGDGLIYSRADTVTVEASTLNNQAGTIQGRTGLALDVSGSVDNRSGRLLGEQGNVALATGSLDNRAGLLTTLAGWLEATVKGLLDNQGGTVQADHLSLKAGSLDNRSGHTSAVAGDALIDTGALDNAGGGLYAGDDLSVQAAAMNNQGGRIGARQIDFSLAGALNNDAGLIESSGSLSLGAAGLTNAQGAIRALGVTGTTLIAITNTLDNRSGLVETANTDLQFQVGGLFNAGGTLRHVGTGSLALTSANAIQAGGTLTTTGDFSLAAASWTHSGVLQARNLTLDVGTFTQTATGKVLAAQSLSATGGHWLNEGLIASDGVLDLRLTGSYSGVGQLTSVGNMDVQVGSMTLGTAARLTAADGLKLEVAGALANGGRLTAGTDLAIVAGSLANTGTLGAAEEVALSTTTLDNERGLIFSGSALTVEADKFTNWYGDVYSLGALTIGGLSNMRAVLIDNVSGNLEAAGDVYLQAQTLRNRREVFSLERTLKESAIGVYCYDCSGDHYTVDYIVRDVYESKIADTTPAAHITSGRDLQLLGGAISNEGSTLSAARNVTVMADSFANQGAVGGTIERIRTFHSGYVTDGTVKRFFGDHADPYNRAYNPNYPGYYYRTTNGQLRLAVPYLDWTCGDCSEPWMTWTDSVTGQFVSIPVNYGTKGSFPTSQYNAEAVKRAVLPGYLSSDKLVSDVEVIHGGGSDVQNAVVQAGGKVTIHANQTLTNSVISPGSAIQSGPRQIGNTSANGTGQPLVVELVSHLPADLTQQQVNPLTLPGFSLPQGEHGLFRLSGETGSATGGVAVGGFMLDGKPLNQSAPNASLSRPAGAHRYLIETNPGLTDLKQFMGSDYLLGHLGYDPDQTQKRLGDGLYEQRLIREAIVARTGQRYLAGLTSDEAMFRYLMDNAVASKDALNLSLGVSLTAEQVAALTHDIVWMEEQEVMGERVLVPVLYLAHAEGRLAPDGALIQGQDVALISGSDLTNRGTLRASQNLEVAAGKIVNKGGVMEAGERLQLLATESIRNAQGGLIAGRNVIASAGGDIINERTVTRNDVSYGNRRSVTDYVDRAATIEASGGLTLEAGGDIANRGSVLRSGEALSLLAGGTVSLGSVEETSLESRAAGRSYLDGHTRQHASETTAGGSLAIEAGSDIRVVGSRVEAQGDIALQAGDNVSLLAAANEDHFFSKSKRVTQSTDSVRQQSSVVHSGGDVSVVAGKDVAMVASSIQAANDVDLDAGQDINILSAKDESASFYYKKSKGSFGRSKSTQKENYDSTNIASVIEAGNDLTINTSKTAEGGLSLDGGRDVTVIGSQLSAGNDLLLGATGDIAVLSGVEEHGSYSKKTKSGFLGLSKSGKSQLKTTASQVASELSADNDVVIAAGNDVRLRASTTAAGNDVELRAGLISSTGDINLVSANDEAYSRSESYKKKVGLSFSDAIGLAVGTPSWGGDIAISSAKKRGQEIISSTNVGSQVNAERDASLIAERDINVVGSGVSAGRNVLLDAGRDVNVVAGTGSEQVTSWKNTKTVGLQQSADGNGFTTFVGAESLKDKIRTSEQTAAASQIDAGLDLDVRAGRDILQQGSDLSAGYDLNMQAGRDIRIDAANEQWAYAREQSQKRTGTSTTVNHNFANTKDAISGAGKGENTVSQASSVLKAVDGVGQFMSGPTFDGHIGSTSQSQSVSQSGTASRGSTLGAGNDVTLTAGDSVVVKGSELQSGRDIKVTAQDILLDVARGEQRYEQEQTQGKGGVVGGTTGGFKVGIGGSHGSATQEGSQGTASGAQLQAGRDILLDASNDLSLIGTEAWAGRDIDLSAGNDLLITAAGNAQGAEEKRRSGGGEVGLTFGSEGIGVYASVNLGRGNLEREGERQQEAYLYAGNRLGFDSGRDTAIAGAQLRGNEVIGRVGGDLLVTSLADTGEVKGREFDLSATVTIGPGSGFSGSVGYGETSGSTHWVENQTRITAAERLDIRTENHTQIDGALIASDSGDLKLDTDTLGFSDIAGHDKEHSYYLNVGGSYSSGGGTQQDASQVGKGKEGESGWSVEGYEYERDRQQIVRATVGEGEIVVRNDEETGTDSTAGLNRDTSKAYEITRDEEERTDLYASKSSVEAVANPSKTLQAWGEALVNYDEQAKANFEQLGVLANASLNELEKLTGRTLAEGAVKAGGAEIAEQTLYGLIMSGMSLNAAKALLANQAFQEQVLANLNDIGNVFSATPDLLKTVERGLAEANLLSLPDVVVLPEQEVTPGALRPEQAILGRVSDINAYIEAHPDQEKAVGFVLAAAQGPKGLMMWAASQALADTPFAEQVAQYQAHLEGILGKAVAEGVERHDLDASYENDAYLLGGGGLIGTLLVGAVAGASNSKAITVKGEGAKGTGAAEVPATSAIARDGLRTT
ncbi:hemagglutinin repeat-containing protein [Stutzerimonas nitrititolerans]|uniref:hemagglutinin repeat-containing protein n=1 Tax=Stutzerimonas nitrititolerans TaxID=2482751 RepID=UPI0028A1A90E|nr:hemagglutinin repeat-containing protein [Stutzerimonas nitrititolerans]